MNGEERPYHSIYTVTHQTSSYTVTRLYQATEHHEQM